MSEIDEKYSAFKARQVKRTRSFQILIFFVIVTIIFGIYLFFEIRWFYYIWINIAVFGVLLWFFYVVTRSWFPEMVETQIFVKFYEAYKCLKLKDDERSQFYSKKAYENAETGTLILKRFVSRINNESRSRLLKTEMGKPLKKLVKNLETRILPRIVRRKDVSKIQEVLFILTQLFSEAYSSLHLNDIIAHNKDLEKLDPLEVEKGISRFRNLLSKEPIKLLLSFAFSFLITVMAVLIHSSFYQINLVNLFSDLGILLQTLGFGSALGLGIYAFLRKKG